jgi:hypothetical protein
VIRVSTADGASLPLWMARASRTKSGTEIDHAKWLAWHGKGRKSVARVKALDASLLATWVTEQRAPQIRAIVTNVTRTQE